MVRVQVQLLDPLPGNVNEMSAESLDWLCEEIRKNGFIDPLEVVPKSDGRYLILGGEHRWKAAQRLAMTEVTCVLLSHERWQDEDLQIFASVRLNQLRGQTNPVKMAAVYSQLMSKYGEANLRRMFAVSDQTLWGRMVKDVRKSLGAKLPRNIQNKFKEKAKKATGIEDLGRVLNEILVEEGETLKHSYLIFTFGEQEHVRIAMTTEMRAALDKVFAYCRAWGKDTNEVIATLTRLWAEDAEAREAEHLGV